MLSIFLTQRLEQAHKDNVVYYFCNSVDKQQNTSAAVLRGLIWQILHKRPMLTRSILSYFSPRERTADVLSTPGTLWGILTCLATHESTGSLYCLIDGLDECDEVSARWLATKLAKHFKNMKQDCLHVAVVSRDMFELESVRSISLDSDNGARVSADVESFTSSRMNELSGLLGFTEDFTLRIQDELL